VSTAGLLNDDDSYADIAIGAPWYDNVSGETVTSNVGRVYVFLGAEDGITGTHATDANIIITGEAADSFFGSAIGSGDFDGDGQGDLVVGAYGYDGQTGRVYVFFASSLMDDQDGMVDAADADVTIDGEADEDLFGSSVSTAGTFFGEMAEAALIVGAPGVNDSSGAFYVFDMRDPPANAANADYPVYGLPEGGRVGISVADLEDVDGDDDSDVGVVSSGSSNGYILIHDEN